MGATDDGVVGLVIGEDMTPLRLSACDSEFSVDSATGANCGAGDSVLLYYYEAHMLVLGLIT